MNYVGLACVINEQMVSDAGISRMYGELILDPVGVSVIGLLGHLHETGCFDMF